MVYNEIMGNSYYALRFTILERDQFTCQYCGQSAPDVRLEVDHIIPVTKGGTDEIENLKTSCYACNMGKNNRLKMETKGSKNVSHKKEIGSYPEVCEYIRVNGPSTATQISIALKRNRANISSLLNNNDSFQKNHLILKGRSVAFELKGSLQ